MKKYFSRITSLALVFIYILQLTSVNISANDGSVSSEAYYETVSESTDISLESPELSVYNVDAISKDEANANVNKKVNQSAQKNLNHSCS